MSFWSDISPTGAASDLLQVWRENPHRWQVLAVASAMTFILMWVFVPESQRVEPRRPTVTYITSWSADRTEEEIIASNLANQQLQDRLDAEAAAREERRKELYRALGRATGLDVDAMEREIAEEEAAEAARAAAAQSAQLGN